MKKSKLICSAIAACFMLALAGCDLEIPEAKKAVKAVADYTVTELPFVYEGVVVQDAVLEPMDSVLNADDSEWDVTTDGLSISFYLSGYTADWSQIFQVPSSNWGTTTAHYCNNKIWVANAYGCSSGNGAWDQFINNDCYVTISMDYSAGTMSYYMNGSLVTVYGGDTTPYGFAGCDAGFPTGTEWVQGILDDIVDTGIYCIHPSDTWANASAGSYKMRYFVIDKAVDAEGAVAKYDAYKAYAGE